MDRGRQDTVLPQRLVKSPGGLAELRKVQPAVERADERTVVPARDKFTEVCLDHSNHVVVERFLLGAQGRWGQQGQAHDGSLGFSFGSFVFSSARSTEWHRLALIEHPGPLGRKRGPGRLAH